MSFLWYFSLKKEEDIVKNDENLEITESGVENQDEKWDRVSIKGHPETGAEIHYRKIDDKWYLAYAGWHSPAAPVIQHLHLTYGEYFKEMDEGYYYDIEKMPLFESDEEAEIIETLYAIQYMDTYEMIEWENDPLITGLRSKGKFLTGTILKYLQYMTSIEPELIRKVVGIQPEQ